MMEPIENHLFSSGESAGDQEFPRGNHLNKKISRKYKEKHISNGKVSMDTCHKYNIGGRT